MEFFESEKISPSTTKITNIQNVFCYLVEGKDRAALIDTGSGAGDLKAYVQSLTKKPVTVILTHGHCDHAGGAAPFQEVYLNEADWELVKVHASMEMKRDYIAFALGVKMEELPENEIFEERTAGYLPLEDGQTFDLGGITLEAVAVPGHTKGMMCILNREERTILFGDGCNPAVFLWDEEALSVEEYLESLKRLKKYEKLYDKVYLSHAATVVDKSILDDVMEVCTEIMQGKADGQPFAFMDKEGLKIAKMTGQDGMRTDGKLGNIVYHPGKIFRSR